MVRVFYFLIVTCFLYSVDANFTKISRKNVLLSRRKRYLVFPMGSNLVMTMSAVKAQFQVQPTGWNVLLEVDVPFALPSDTRFFSKKKKKSKEKRSIYSQLGTAFTESGLNGTVCVQRIMCDAQQYIPLKGKSLVKDLLMAIFTSTDEGYNLNCERNSWADCEVPFLSYILNSLENGISEKVSN